MTRNKTLSIPECYLRGAWSPNISPFKSRELGGQNQTNEKQTKRLHHPLRTASPAQAAAPAPAASGLSETHCAAPEGSPQTPRARPCPASPRPSSQASWPPPASKGWRPFSASSKRLAAAGLRCAHRALRVQTGQDRARDVVTRLTCDAQTQLVEGDGVFSSHQCL